jgi:4-amino-4-deoxy-L-arabinose transferase-like glycosyltransferase
VTEVHDSTDDAAANAMAGSPAAATSSPGAEAQAIRRSPWLILRGVALALVGFLALALQMASSRQIHHGGLLGLVSAAVMVIGLLDAMGLLRGSPDDRALLATSFGPLPGESRFLAPMVTLPLAFALVAVGLLLGHDVEWALSPILLAAFAVLGLSAFRRPALIPILVIGAIYLPRLGSYALWDPWETHYGEVAREMLSRDDWISPWWAQEEWFWSKPVFIFWTEAWTMSALGVSPLPDAHPEHAEWALRLPIFVMSMAAIVAVQAFASRAFGRRAGILSALVVGTMPHFYLLAHQAITDMPLTASLTIAVSLLGLALLDDGATVPPGVRVGPFSVSARTAAMGALLMIGLPPLVYLLTRNITFFPGEGFSVHGDIFLKGSAGNDGVSGNVAVTTMSPAFRHPQPAAQALIWANVLAGTAFLVYRARTRRAVFLVGFYIACAIGLLGKGIPGFALPGLVALLYLVSSRRWWLLLDGQLRVTMGAGIITALGMPWYVAMYVRHGRPFVDRILIHDHINRLASGVHGDNGPIDYFLSQLGFATFPWVGLVPLAVLAFAWLPRAVSVATAPGDAPGEPTIDARREATILVGLWAMAGFTLFNAMVTKFHHYIFPVIPPAGLLVGVLLDRFLGDDDASDFASTGPDTRRTLRRALIGTGTIALLFAIAGAHGSPRGIAPANATGPDWVLRHGWPLSVVVALSLLGVSFLALAIRMANKPADASGKALDATERGLGAAAIGASILVGFVGRDISWVTASHPHGYERFIHLFVYLYGRPWPDYIDYRPVFAACSIMATTAMFMIAFRRLRTTAVGMLLVVALSLTTFSVNVYLPDLAEHWSTNGLIDRYYAQRRGREPLIAFQMNWKGENFYTGNRVQVFQDVDTAIIRRYFDTHRGIELFALTEHTRVDALRTLLPLGSRLEHRSTKRDNNKFLLVHIRVSPRAATADVN